MAVFEEVYEKYSTPVYRFLLSLCGETQMAEELLQETFYQAFVHMDRFEGRCSLYGWLCQIGKHAWFKECRRRKRFAAEAVEDMPLADSSPVPEETVIRREQLSRIRQALAMLEEPYQGVFIMHVFGEVKLTDIAAAYKKSDSWARMTYLRAKEKLFRHID